MVFNLALYSFFFLRYVLLVLSIAIMPHDNDF